MKLQGQRPVIRLPDTTQEECELFFSDPFFQLSSIVPGIHQEIKFRHGADKRVQLQSVHKSAWCCLGSPASNTMKRHAIPDASEQKRQNFLGGCSICDRCPFLRRNLTAPPFYLCQDRAVGVCLWHRNAELTGVRRLAFFTIVSQVFDRFWTKFKQQSFCDTGSCKQCV